MSDILPGAYLFLSLCNGRLFEQVVILKQGRFNRGFTIPFISLDYREKVEIKFAYVTIFLLKY